MIPWIQAQVDESGASDIEVIVSPPSHPQLGLRMDVKEAIAAATALLHAASSLTGLELKISAKPIPRVLRCRNKTESLA